MTDKNNNRDSARVPTLRWQGGSEGQLWLIDQTLLPLEVREIVCRSVQDVWDAIKRLAVRGAPAIGVSAAYGVVLGLRAANSLRLRVKGPFRARARPLIRIRREAVAV